MMNHDEKKFQRLVERVRVLEARVGMTGARDDEEFAEAGSLEYLIVTSESQKDLSKIVQDNIAEGFRPIGGISAIVWWNEHGSVGRLEQENYFEYNQTMVRGDV
jgi:hypothetical protein